MITYALPIVWTIQPRTVSVFWAESDLIIVTHVFLVSGLSDKPCNTPLKYRSSIKKSKYKVYHVRLTYLTKRYRNCSLIVSGAFEQYGQGFRSGREKVKSMWWPRDLFDGDLAICAQMIHKRWLSGDGWKQIRLVMIGCFVTLLMMVRTMMTWRCKKYQKTSSLNLQKELHLGLWIQCLISGTMLRPEETENCVKHSIHFLSFPPLTSSYNSF